MEGKLTSLARVAAGALAAAATWACAARAGVPVRWDVETSRVQPAMFTAYRGETLELEARLFSYGRPLEGGPGAAVGLYWQTDGMGTAWWRAPATAVSNALSAVWSPSNDVGAAAYSCFIGEPGGSWRAAFRLRMLASPGAVPNELPPPVRVIDFAAVAATNAPWATAAEAGAAAAASAGAVVGAFAATGTVDVARFAVAADRAYSLRSDGDYATLALCNVPGVLAYRYSEGDSHAEHEWDLSAMATTNYVDAATNALAAAIGGGGAEPAGWARQSPPVAWTNAPVEVEVPAGGTLSFTGDWPDAQPVYLRVVTGGAYTPDAQVVKLGYGGWPQSPFHAVTWKIPDGKYLLNILYVEDGQ